MDEKVLFFAPGGTTTTILMVIIFILDGVRSSFFSSPFGTFLDNVSC